MQERRAAEQTQLEGVTAKMAAATTSFYKAAEQPEARGAAMEARLENLAETPVALRGGVAAMQTAAEQPLSSAQL